MQLEGAILTSVTHFLCPLTDSQSFPYRRRIQVYLLKAARQNPCYKYWHWMLNKRLPENLQVGILCAEHVENYHPQRGRLISNSLCCQRVFDENLLPICQEGQISLLQEQAQDYFAHAFELILCSSDSKTVGLASCNPDMIAGIVKRDRNVVPLASWGRRIELGLDLLWRGLLARSLQRCTSSSQLSNSRLMTQQCYHHQVEF